MGEHKRKKSAGTHKTPRRHHRKPRVKPFAGPTLTPVREESPHMPADKTAQLTRHELSEMKPAEVMEALLAAREYNKTLGAQLLSAQRLQENSMMEVMAAKDRLHKTYLQQKEAECDAIVLRNETLNWRERYATLSDTFESSYSANDEVLRQRLEARRQRVVSLNNEVERTKRERDEAVQQNDKMHAWLEAVNDDRRTLLQRVHKLENEQRGIVEAPEKRTPSRNPAAKHETAETKSRLPVLRRPRANTPRLDSRLSKSSSKDSLSDSGAENAQPKLQLPKIQVPKSPARVVQEKSRSPLLPPISTHSAPSGGDRTHPHRQQPSRTVRSSPKPF